MCINNKICSFFLIIAIISFNTGCAVIRVAEHGSEQVMNDRIASNKTYPEKIKTLPTLESGFGRIFVYMKEERVLGADYISIDDYAHIIFERSFFYEDVKQGSHVATINEMQGLFGMLRHGKTRKEISVNDGETVYVRVAPHDMWIKGIAQIRYEYSLEIVGHQEALADISDLHYYASPVSKL